MLDEIYYRVSGDALCPICRESYRNHPLETKFDAEDGQEIHFRRICNGDLVKL